METGKTENSSLPKDRTDKDMDARRLEWLETFHTLEEINASGGVREKMGRKVRENPFVPIGLLATTAALSFGVYAMKTGNKRRSQLMMRARILAQGFTVAALLVGIGITAVRTGGAK